eukprot:6206561-Pyramimonas_sp.AAC.1
MARMLWYMESKKLMTAIGAPMALSARQMNWRAKLGNAWAMSSDTSTGSAFIAPGPADAMRLSTSSSNAL